MGRDDEMMVQQSIQEEVEAVTERKKRLLLVASLLGLRTRLQPHHIDVLGSG
jgi:hypothetical protein